MSQYNFGTIDPYVVDGIQLAGMLNNWRDAIHSWHRGPSRPSYVVPGMMWINDAGGASNWIVNVFISAGVGDKAIFTYNTTTGDITLSAAAGGSLLAAILLAQATTVPSVRWNATSNPIDAKAWRATVDAAGALVLSSYSDAGVLQNSITFNRNGTLTTNTEYFEAKLTSVLNMAGGANVLIPFVTNGSGAFAGPNVGNRFNNALSRFTPGVISTWALSFAGYVNSDGFGGLGMFPVVNGATWLNMAFGYTYANGLGLSVSGSFVRTFAATDYVEFFATNSTAVGCHVYPSLLAGNGMPTWFSGHRIA